MSCKCNPKYRSGLLIMPETVDAAPSTSPGNTSSKTLFLIACAVFIIAFIFYNKNN